MKNKFDIFCYQGKITDPELHTKFREVTGIDLHTGTPVFAEGLLWIYNAEDKEFQVITNNGIIGYKLWDGTLESIKHIEVWANDMQVRNYKVVTHKVIEGVVSANLTIKKEDRRVTLVSLEPGDYIVKLRDGSFDAMNHEEVVERCGPLPLLYQ